MESTGLNVKSIVSSRAVPPIPGLTMDWLFGALNNTIGCRVIEAFLSDERVPRARAS